MVEKELVAATSASIILSMLRDTESYGYEIIQRVADMTDGELEWTEAMLYPVLHRLEARALLKSHWQTPPGGRKRKYYSITPAGRYALKDKQRQWAIVSSVLDRLWI